MMKMLHADGGLKIRITTYPCHPAGDVTRVSVMPRKVTVKIGCGGFTEYFPGSRELPWLPPTQDSHANASLEAELLGVTSIP